MEATASFAEKAASIDSTSSAAMAEVGRQCLLRGRIKEAQKYYKVGGSSPSCSSIFFQILAFISAVCSQMAWLGLLLIFYYNFPRHLITRHEGREI